MSFTVEAGVPTLEDIQRQLDPFVEHDLYLPALKRLKTVYTKSGTQKAYALARTMVEEFTEVVLRESITGGEQLLKRKR